MPVVGQPPGEQHPDFHHFVRFLHYKILELDLLISLTMVDKQVSFPYILDVLDLAVPFFYSAKGITK